jgi:hypothetical protein
MPLQVSQREVGTRKNKITENETKKLHHSIRLNLVIYIETGIHQLAASVRKLEKLGSWKDKKMFQNGIDFRNEVSDFPTEFLFRILTNYRNRLRIQSRITFN